MCIGVQTAGLWLEVVRVFHAAAGVHRRAARFGAATAVVLRLVTNCGPSAVKVARLGTTYIRLRRELWARTPRSQ